MEVFFKGSVTIESLVNYIEGSVNDSVKEEIELWLQAHENNQTFFNGFSQAWLSHEDLSPLLNENKQRDWDSILNALHSKKPEITSGKTKFNIRWLQRIAAAVLLIVFSGIGYFAGKHQPDLPLLIGSTIYHEIVVPDGEKSALTLSDGTIMWINAGSKVRFPSAFNIESRDIWLDGEAYFEVARDKKRPFFVHTSNVDVKVYGTKFNLKAYDDEDVFEATLIEGLVSLETKDMLGSTREEVFLEPNRKAIYLKKKPENIERDIVQAVTEPLKPRKIIISNPVKVESSISWREGKLEFNDETLENIAIKLERRYGVEIEMDGKEVRNVRYSGVLKNISIEQALKAIQMTADFSYSIDDNIVIIKDKERKKGRN